MLPVLGLSDAVAPPLTWIDILALVVGVVGAGASIVGWVYARKAARGAESARQAAQRVATQYQRELARSGATDASHLLDRALHSLRDNKHELAEHQVNEAQRALLVVAVFTAGLEKDWVARLGQAGRDLIDASKRIAVLARGDKVSKTRKAAIEDTLRDKRELTERLKVELVARGSGGQHG